MDYNSFGRLSVECQVIFNYETKFINKLCKYHHIKHANFVTYLVIKIQMSVLEER